MRRRLETADTGTLVIRLADVMSLDIRRDPSARAEE
jgi:hypothetical protein